MSANLFYGTGIPAVILVFKKHKKNKTVFFIAGREFEDGTNQNRLRAEDIDKIVAGYKARKSVAKYAHVADFEEVKENDFI